MKEPKIILKKQSKIIQLSITICLAIITVVGLFFLYRTRVLIWINENLEKPMIQELNLSPEEKIADFESFYDTIITSHPSLEEEKALYQIDFKDRKSYYTELINKTCSDFEFFCAMVAIVADVPSFHTSLHFPSYSRIRSLNCYNAKNILSDGNLKPRIDYWFRCIQEACDEYETVQKLNVKYVEGKYIYDPLDSSDRYSDLNHCEVTTIDGVPVDIYMQNHVALYGLEYDYIRNKAYRPYRVFNDRIGEKIEITFRHMDGNLTTKELYSDLRIEAVDAYSYLFGQGGGIVKKKHMDSYVDEEKGIGYLAVNNFDNPEGEKLKSMVLSMQDCENIIVDLRGNYGGYLQYADEYLYRYLYKDGITMNVKWEIPDSEKNKIINKDYLNVLFRKGKDIGDSYVYEEQHRLQGGEKNIKNVYYLVDNRTGSAADRYISMMKRNDKGLILGSNTGGEGLGESFCCYSLENSGLVYIYYPAKTWNDDGTDNSVYGTRPDVYVEDTIDGFYKKRELLMNNIDETEFENRRLWDNVLNYTIDFIGANK